MTTSPSPAGAGRLEQIEQEVESLRVENARLRMLLVLAQQSREVIAAARPVGGATLGPVDALVHAGSPAAVKVGLVRRLFRGRDDVYAVRFENR